MFRRGFLPPSSPESGEGSEIRVGMGYKCETLPTTLWPFSYSS